MNSKFSLKDTVEMPVQIFESEVETSEIDEANPPTQAGEEQELETPPTMAPQDQDPPRETMKIFSCGKCGLACSTASEVEVHLGTNH